MTKKTGNYKKFPIFVEMILSGMQKVCSFNQTSTTVSLDILTLSDLKQLNAGAKDDRLYLIVTYAVAFDRFFLLTQSSLSPTVDAAY